MSTNTAAEVREDAVPQEAKEPKGRKTASPKKKPQARRVSRLRVLTTEQASAEAIRTGHSVDSGTIFTMPVSGVKSYNNPRHEPAALYEQGYVLIGKADVDTPDVEKGQFVSLIHMALSENMQRVEHFVKLVREHENVDRKEHPDAPQSICELAEDIKLFGQLVPVSITKDGIMGDGGRRLCAILLLHAESRVKRFRKADDAPSKVFPATIQATDIKCKRADLFRMSVKINLSRKNFTELQEGRVYHEMLTQRNPATGNPYTMKEAAEELLVPYGTFRNREALWRPRNERTGRGLSDADRRAVAEGRMTVTAAARRSLGEKHYSPTGTPQANRNRGIPLKEMHRLFDETPASNAVRRQAIAECMGIDLKVAIQQSMQRIDAAADRLDREQDRTGTPNVRSKKRSGKAA